jgi:outer membrane PBP1 activator LpoA protein
MKYLLTALVLSLVLTACTNPEGAASTLAAQGYTDIEIKPYGIMNAFQCSEDDQLRTRFRAKSPSGAIVNGVVCQGFLKGSTIRFD